MNRRGFLRAVGAAVAWSWVPLARAAGSDELSVDATIRTAIARRRTLAFTYQALAREVEPHALGLTPGGKRALLAWQFSGGSHSEPPPGWRLFLLAEMQRVSRRGREFSPRPDYRPAGCGLREIECDVTGSPPAATNPPATSRG